MLLERHGIEVSRETLRKWLVEAGCGCRASSAGASTSRGSGASAWASWCRSTAAEHRWFEQRGEPCTLLVFIDDATSRLMQLRFVPSESTASYFEVLHSYLQTHGCPVAFYSDKHSVFRVNRPDTKNGSGMTQFGRALAELNIESKGLRIARSSRLVPAAVVSRPKSVPFLFRP